MSLTRRDLLITSLNAAIGVAVPARLALGQGTTGGASASVQLIRNGTCLVRYGGRTLLLDPYLSDQGATPPINNTPNPRPNPLVPLPMPAGQVIAAAEVTLLTHTHFDHWDPVAREQLPKGRPVFVQPADRERVLQAGFTDVRPVEPSLSWEGISITRTGAQHGTGDVGRRMGAVSGYVLSKPGQPTVYLAGDTVWCPEVEEAIRTHRPDVIVVNAGEAQFLEGGPIIMGVADVVRVCAAAPRARVVAVHMEAVNHCLLTRDGLRAGLRNAGVTSTVLVPRDGEAVSLA